MRRWFRIMMMFLVLSVYGWGACTGTKLTTWTNTQTKSAYALSSISINNANGYNFVLSVPQSGYIELNITGVALNTRAALYADGACTPNALWDSGTVATGTVARSGAIFLKAGTYSIQLSRVDSSGTAKLGFSGAFTLPTYPVDSTSALCYDPISTSGFSVMGFGEFYGVTTPIRNTTSYTLSDVTVVQQLNGFTVTGMETLKIDGTSKTTATDSDEAEVDSNFSVNYSTLNLTSGVTNGIVYHLSSIAPNASNNLYEESMVSYSSASTTYQVLYTRNGVTYQASMGACPINKPTTQCDLFPSALSSIQGITTTGNSIQVCNGTALGYPYTLTPPSLSCNTSDTCSNKTDTTCTRVNPPDPYTVSFPAMPSGTVTVSSNTTWSADQVYSNSSSQYKVMGDVILSGNNVTLTLGAGDYYFNSLTLPDNGQSIVLSGAPVRIFVKNNITFSANSYTINPNANADNLFIYAGGNLSFAGSGGGNGGMNAYFYSKGTTTINNNTSNWILTGGITSEGQVYITGNNPDIIAYTDPDSILANGYGTCKVKVGWDQTVVSIPENTSLPYDTAEPVSVYLRLNHTVSYPIVVHYRTADNTAVSDTNGGSDYVALDTAVTIPADTLTYPVPMYIYHDQPIELDENFTLTAYSPSGSDDVILDTTRSVNTVRIPAQETAPVCYSDSFATTLDSKWRTLYSLGGYTPALLDGRLRLTPGKYDISTAVTKDYEFPSKYNLITIEFTHYAYGACYQQGSGSAGIGTYGADGMAMVLYNSKVGSTPVPGAYGGSLGYAPHSGQAGFEGGWLGLGIDEYGNFSNPTEGRVGGPGFRTNAVALRGDGNGTSGYEYLAGTGVLSTPVARPASEYKNPVVGPGDKYRMKIDARDPAHLYITLDRDTGSGYTTILTKFDAKDAVYGQGETPDLVRIALTASTGSGCNAHEVDDVVVSGWCDPYATQPTSYYTGLFDMWDTNRSVSNRKISTKVVGKSFDLTVGALNSTWTALETKPAGIVAYYRLFDVNNTKYLTPWNTMEANSSATQNVTYKINSASPKVRVEYAVCADYNGTLYAGSRQLILKGDANCTNANIDVNSDCTELNATCYRHFYSSDSFAIRPDAFNLFTTTGFKRAGENFALLLKAVPYNTSLAGGGSANTIKTASGYNASVNTLTFTPVKIQRHLDENGTEVDGDTCPTIGTISAPSGSFSDGNVTITTNYTETGFIDLNVSETSGSEWAYVDRNDTEDILRYITPSAQAYDISAIDTERTLGFVPYQVVITGNVNTTTNKQWLYMAGANNVLRMGEKADYTLTAKNMQGNPTLNFTKTCFAYDETNCPSIDGLRENTTFDMNLTLKLTQNSGANRSVYVRSSDGNLTKDATIANGVLTTLVVPTLPSGSFVNGVATQSLYYNVDRSYTTPTVPFVMSTSELGAVNAGVLSQFVVQSLTTQHTMVYGRLIPQDVRWFDKTTPFKAKGFYEIYGASTLLGNALMPSVTDRGWYINKLHTDGTDGDANVTLIVPSASLPTPTTSTSGIEVYTFGAMAYGNYKAHIKTDPWLWYGINALNYADPASSNTECLTHPCINIAIIQAVGSTGSSKETTDTSTTRTNKGTTVNSGSWNSTSDYTPSIR